MEIEKILTLSTAHIKESTSLFLDNENREELIVFEKSEFGWFIYLGTEVLEEEIKHIPDDLVKVIRLAQKHDSKWLCLDRDGDEVNELPKYNW